MAVNYYIVAVKKDYSDRITDLKTHDGTVKPRQQVVYDIDSLQLHVMTAIKGNDGKYYEGADVHVYNGKWLRTDQNRIEADNLDNLPLF